MGWVIAYMVAQSVAVAYLVGVCFVLKRDVDALRDRMAPRPRAADPSGGPRLS